MAEILDYAPQRVVELWVVERGRADALVERAQSLGVRIRAVTAEALQARAGELARGGVVALTRPRPLGHEHDLVAEVAATAPGRAIWLGLDGVEDPQNLGAILRSAEFFGVRSVFWAPDRAVGLTGAAVRASAGASERIGVIEVGNLARALRACKDAGAWIVGTVPEGGRPLPELTAPSVLPDRLVVVMGGEHRGLRRLTREHCDFLLTIPRRGAVASLNVAAATAVVLSALAAPEVAPGGPRLPSAD